MSRLAYAVSGIVLVLGGVTFLACHSPSALRAAGPATQPGQPAVAVVELFTSEGCSSCPPADAVLAELASATWLAGERVIALSFHVDYWDRLGWRDPFSDASFSERQRDYGRAKRSDEIYTPQMFVNGGEGFVGSDRKRALAEIASAASAQPFVALTLAARRVSGGVVQIDCSLGQASDDAMLNVAVVQRTANSRVAKGENSGKSLDHVNVVRAFKSVAVRGKSGTTAISPPAVLAGRDGLIVAYLQRVADRRVIGAATIDLPTH